MFVGRGQEMQTLERLYRKDSFECVVIYGRRRVGKTTLINEFIRDKQAIFYSGVDSNEQQNLDMISSCIWETKEMRSHASFHSWVDVLEEICNMAKEKRLVLVLDEFPYLANSFSGISSLLATWIDQHFMKTKLFLIICGSSLSFMEEQVLGYQSPLYGRRTAQMKIMPFSFSECRKYFHNFSKEDLAVAYGITGGIPLYLSKLDDSATIAENIIENFFEPSAYMFEEPEKLLQQECREPRQYNAIITAIAGGAFRISDITTRAGMKDTAATVAYINKLRSLGIVDKESPYKQAGSRKSIYKLSDGMFQFWYRFVPSNMSLIQQGLGVRVYERMKDQISSYMGFIFEDICREYLWQENIAGRLPVEFVDIGRWWGNNPIQKREEEIDLLGDNDQEEAVFVECKWRNEDVGEAELKALAEQTKLFHYRRNVLVLCAKKGFTTGCRELAEKMEDVILIRYQDMEWEEGDTRSSADEG